jgi:hypothetical protein
VIQNVLRKCTELLHSSCFVSELLANSFCAGVRCHKFVYVPVVNYGTGINEDWALINYAITCISWKYSFALCTRNSPLFSTSVSSVIRDSIIVPRSSLIIVWYNRPIWDHSTMRLSLVPPSSLWALISFTDAYSPGRSFDLPFRGFLITHTHRHTVGLLWTSDQPVAETSTFTEQHNRQTSMPRAGLELATPATKRPQTYALDRAATGIGIIIISTSRNTRRCSGFKIKWKNSSDMFVAGFWIVATPNLVGIG